MEKINELLKTVYDFIKPLIKIAGQYVIIDYILPVSIILAIVLGIVFTCIKGSGYAVKLNRVMRKSNRFIKKNGKITDDNVELYEYKVMNKMPKIVSKAWGRYREVGRGLPSDFITKNDCLQIPAVKYTKRRALRVYTIIWSVFAALVSLVILVSGGMVEAPEVVDAPLLLYTTLKAVLIIFVCAMIPGGVLASNYDNADVKLQKNFLKFIDKLDNNVEIIPVEDIVEALPQGRVAHISAPVLQVEAPKAVEKQLTREEKFANFVEHISSVCRDSTSTLDTIKALKREVLDYMQGTTLNDKEMDKIQVLLDDINRKLIDLV